MLLSVYMQIFWILKIQGTAILLDRMNLKTGGGFSSPSPPPCLHPCVTMQRMFVVASTGCVHYHRNTQQQCKEEW